MRGRVGLARGLGRYFCILAWLGLWRSGLSPYHPFMAEPVITPLKHDLMRVLEIHLRLKDPLTRLNLPFWDVVALSSRHWDYEVDDLVIEIEDHLRKVFTEVDFRDLSLVAREESLDGWLSRVVAALPRSRPSSESGPRHGKRI